MGAVAAMLPNQLWSQPVDKLPKVLILGDSISIGYFPFVKELLKGKAEVSRPFKVNGNAENCQGTTNGIANIDRWLGDASWDVIHFNFGLHDLKHVDPDTGKNSNDPKDPPQADIKQYNKNLKEIVGKLKTTGARLIFATTTPFPEGTKPYRAVSDAEKYNKVARKIMKKNDIAINDLYAFVTPRMEQFQKPVNVHFTNFGSKALAEEVAQSISEKL